MLVCAWCRGRAEEWRARCLCMAGSSSSCSRVLKKRSREGEGWAAAERIGKGVLGLGREAPLVVLIWGRPEQVAPRWRGDGKWRGARRRLQGVRRGGEKVKGRGEWAAAGPVRERKERRGEEGARLRPGSCFFFWFLHFSF